MTGLPRDSVRARLTEFERSHSAELDWLASKADELLRACQEVRESWSGSFIGWHGRMYFRDFAKPSHHQMFSGEWGDIHGLPDGWEEKDDQQVAAKIDTIIGGGFSVKGFEGSVNSLRGTMKELQEDLEDDLALLDVGKMPRAKEIVESISSLAPPNRKAEHIQKRIPTSHWSRDSEALRQGTCLPCWLYYEGVAVEARNVGAWYAEYRRLFDRLIRVMAATPGSRAEVPMSGVPAGHWHTDIVAKCSALYDAGEYAEAVEKSFKIVRDRLRTLTGYETGSESFGKGKLFIKGAAAPNVESDFNQAVKFLTMAIDMFRNEKSHTSDAKITDPTRAHQYIALSSLALSLLENAEIRP